MTHQLGAAAYAEYAESIHHIIHSYAAILCGGKPSPVYPIGIEDGLEPALIYVGEHWIEGPYGPLAIAYRRYLDGRSHRSR